MNQSDDGKMDRATAESPKFLCDLPVGSKGAVLGFDVAPSQRIRLLEMGLTEGTEFRIVRLAPLGDPIDVKLRGYHLSLRRKEAGGIRVKSI
jgi:Fe2+ transport system protein FeoA